MAKVAKFPFNPFQENTYVVYDDSMECIIIDPGCYSQQERDELISFINKTGLTPVRLINTHCHLDHILGNKFIYKTYGLLPEFTHEEQHVLDSAPQFAGVFGISFDPSPQPKSYLQAGETLTFGNTGFDILFTPGHSPGHITLYSEADRFILSADVLFQGSIGRVDLPGGDYDTLINSIEEKLLPLGDDIHVYTGHGPDTTLAQERQSNPFLVNS
jgi:glyoxylase-like metal-dependent hydrolase (beta-lactamase superfamily II)